MIQSSYSLSFNNKALLNNSKEMLWQRNIYQVTTSTDGHGTMTASPMSGFTGTNVTLSNTPNANYGFSGYSITGATLTGNQFTLNNDVTARAGFSAEPTSALYWSDAGSNVATIGTNIVKNVNKAVTAFNYFTVKFSLKTIWDSYFYYGAGHFYMNFDKGSWYILNHEGYPTNGYAGIRSERNTGEKFYPTTAARSRAYPKNSQIYTYYASKLITTQVNYKYVIDRSNARFSPVLDNVYMGYGNTSANITAINSLTGSYGGNTASTGKMTASNYSIAGFSNLSDALNY